MITLRTVRVPDTVLPLQAVLLAGALLTVISAVGALLWQPALALLPVAALVATLLLINAPFRTVFLVFGGMAALNSSQGLDIIKLAYFLGVGLAATGAVFNVWRIRSSPSARLMRQLFVVSLFAGMLLVSTALVSLTNGTPATAWFRDAAPYGLFAAIPIFALDIHSSSSERTLIIVLIVAGLLTSVFNSVYWMDHRQLAQLPFEELGRPGAGLRSAIFVYAVSAALLGGRGRLGWTLIAGSTLALTWITGNRGGSIMLPAIAILIGLFSMKRQWSVVRPTLRVATIAVAALTIASLLIVTMTRLADYDVQRLAGRFESIVSISEDPNSDGSYRERTGQTNAAWDAIGSSPIIGVGPGYEFEWPDYKGDTLTSFNMDTGLAIPAKFGIGGMVVLVALSMAYFALMRKASVTSGLTTAHVALGAFIVLAVVGLPFSTPFEDKSFAFGLLLLLALSLPFASGTGGYRAPSVSGVPIA